MSDRNILTDIELLEKMSSFIDIAHKSSGRVRLKFDKAILEYISQSKLEEFGVLNFKGVKDSKVNKMAKSITISYDPKIIPDEIWTDLCEGKNLQTISELFLELKKEADA